MKIVEFKIYRFHLKLKKTLKLKDKSINFRDGLLLKLTNNNNNIGWGEASPLLAFSRETTDEALKQLKELSSDILNKEIPNNISQLTDELFPSVSFGVETALLNLMALSKGLALSSLINIHSSKEISINALLSGDSILEQAIKLKEEGYTAFKLKVGRQSISDDIKLIKQTREIIGEDSILRLDANRAFEFNEACELINQIKKSNIEYIEEPFNNKSDLQKYIEQNKDSQIALDETLGELSIKQLADFKKVKAFILKPTMLGFVKTMDYARFAIENNITPVISSSFESIMGVKTLASMAAIINSDKLDIPVGLDTLDCFEENLLDDDKIIVNGKIDLSTHSFTAYKLNYDKLQEVSLE